MFANFIPVLAATDAAVPEDHGKQRSGVTPFPSEAPSDDELREWLKYNVPILKQLYGAAIRDQTPSHLVQFEQGADDLSDFVRIAPGTAAAAGLTAVQLQMHNRRVAEAEAAKAERAASLASGRQGAPMLRRRQGDAVHSGGAAGRRRV